MMLIHVGFIPSKEVKSTFILGLYLVNDSDWLGDHEALGVSIVTSVIRCKKPNDTRLYGIVTSVVVDSAAVSRLSCLPL